MMASVAGAGSASWRLTYHSTPPMPPHRSIHQETLGKKSRSGSEAYLGRRSLDRSGRAALLPPGSKKTHRHLSWRHICAKDLGLRLAAFGTGEESQERKSLCWQSS